MLTLQLMNRGENLKKIFYLIYEKRPMQVRLLALFLILIYIPILFNVFFIQRQTLSAIEDDQKERIVETVERTGRTLQDNLLSIKDDLEDFADQPGVQKGLEDYETMVDRAQEGFHNYMDRQISSIENSSSYIGNSAIITKDLLAFRNSPVFEDSFTGSSLFLDLLAENLEDGWYSVPYHWVFSPEEPSEDDAVNEEEQEGLVDNLLVYVQSIPYLEIEGTVGYVFVSLDYEAFADLYRHVYIGEDGNISLWYDDFSPFYHGQTGLLPEDLLREHSRSAGYASFQSDDENQVFYSFPLEELPAILTANIPQSSLTRSIQEPLRMNLYLITLISTLVAIWIFVEIFIISNIVTQKEVASYRLSLSEELNEKLRMYKHDFSNHLQVIQGLLHLDHKDRAIGYIQRIAEDGTTIHSTYEVGIPEIEAVLYDAVLQTKLKDIQLNIKTIQLPDSLTVDLYDLVKSLSNIVKNGVEALEGTDEKEKILSIEIYETQAFFGFRVTNNHPLIPKEHQNKLFDKGFSTKDKGSGYGLYMAKELIERNNGRIQVDVNENGNHFIVEIPKGD